MKAKILNWLADGQTGVSSEAMAFTALGVTIEDRWHRCTPHDPADLNRCLLLVEDVPEIKTKFPEIAALSKGWAILVEHWDELRDMFINEAGRNWSKTQDAPPTFQRMKELKLREGDYD